MPLSTLHPAPRGTERKTRGQDGSLLLSCGSLSSPTTRRFIPTLALPHGHGSVTRQKSGRACPATTKQSVRSGRACPTIAKTYERAAAQAIFSRHLTCAAHQIQCVTEPRRSRSGFCRRAKPKVSAKSIVIRSLCQCSILNITPKYRVKGVDILALCRCP